MPGRTEWFARVDNSNNQTNIMKKSTAPFLNYLLVVSLLAVSWVAQAQPSTGGPAPATPDPTAVPLDGGASLLLAGGVAYGLRRLQRKRSTN